MNHVIIIYFSYFLNFLSTDYVEGFRKEFLYQETMEVDINSVIIITCIVSSYQQQRYFSRDCLLLSSFFKALLGLGILNGF